MSDGIIVGCGGGGEGGTLVVTGVAGDTVTIAKDGKTYSRTVNNAGQAVFKGLASGEWTVTMTNGVETTTETVNIVADYTLELGYNTPPTYTYTGESTYVDEGDGNWHLKLLTSGNLTFTNLGNAKELEVFLVGGGAGGTKIINTGGNGGGGGYVNNGTFAPQKNTAYDAVIGAGGAINGGSGGTTTIFDLTANGGSGSNGGSGGGGGTTSGGGTSGETGGVGGTNGGNGKAGSNGSSGGTGAGVTTIPWGDEPKYGRYAGGGGGGGGYEDYGGAGGAGGGGKGGNSSSNGTSGSTNTGGGGGGGSYGGNGGAGGSGIILIRNKRTV